MPVADFYPSEPYRREATCGSTPRPGCPRCTTARETYGWRTDRTSRYVSPTSSPRPARSLSSCCAEEVRGDRGGVAGRVRRVGGAGRRLRHLAHRMGGGGRGLE